MNTLKFRLSLGLAISATGLPMLVLSPASNASIPDTAIISKFNRTTDFPLIRRGHTSPIPANQDDRLRSWLYESIIIPAGGAWANLKFTYKNANVPPLVKVGPGSKSGEYLFPCRTTGNATIGWSLINARSGGCLTMRVKADGTAVVNRLPLRYAQATGLADPAHSLLIAQDSVPSKYYCGAIANTGEWGISAGAASLEQACTEAEQQCSGSAAGSECTIVSLGDWQPTETDLVASMVCTSSVADRRGEPISLLNSKSGNPSTIESQLAWLAERNRFLNSKACVPSIYGAADAIVSPTTAEPTLIQTRSIGGSLAIDVLAGSVHITSATRPEGLFLVKGTGYRQRENRLASLDCPAIYQTEAIQSFLDPAHWSGEEASELRGYRRAFCQTGPQAAAPSPGGPSFIFNIMPTWNPRPYPSPSTPSSPAPSPNDSSSGSVDSL
ncbi:MAG: DUF4189 domain-containing protein [Aphanocapsa sp. GSE-SYN-MK-11-07L]|jgi:hypothetical protein|nr:DUF4189 domain-containing protein [Aphanocapsa sp. GSE-SYN-MK-11-07L]